jgi:hypothetical protein
LGNSGLSFQDEKCRNKVLRWTGFADFVTSVLVLELATRLIKGNMGVDWRKACEILHESADLGDILHERE